MMLVANINIDQLAAEIAKGLAEYSQDVRVSWIPKYL